MENGGPYRSGPKLVEQIEIFWSYRSVSSLVDGVNRWLYERADTIKVISCEFVRGNFILLRYRANVASE